MTRKRDVIPNPSEGRVRNLLFARMNRTLPSDAFDPDLDSDLDLNPEGHGFSRADKLTIKSTRLQPLRAGENVNRTLPSDAFGPDLASDLT